MLFTSHLSAQNLSDHRWKNRLILILTNDTSLSEYQKQLDEFRSQEKGMGERKLIVYHITPTQYRAGLGTTSDWHMSNKLYLQFHEKEKDFAVLLIGLDGGVKLRQNKLLTCEKLFSAIDIMPMRQAEMRRKN